MTEPYEWLIDRSQEFLLYEGNTHSIVGAEQLAASQVSMLKQQVQLRKRAGKRFPSPEKWLWTARSFSQASDWYSAHFKASVVPEGCRVVDGCCAAGSDLVALAQRGPAIGIDLDPELVALARHNLTAHQMSAEVQKSDLIDCESWMEPEDWLHVDPDRGGPEGKTTRSDQFSPSLPSVLSLAEKTAGSFI
ncbi:MAG: class I SAM-dependent methyltransferase, partial [Planctomycetota bacterium]